MKLATIMTTCTALLATAAAGQERQYRLPTATEVFQLRSACGELGYQLAKRKVVPAGHYQAHASRYDPKTNRCFVRLMVTTDPPKVDDYLDVYLYDGQSNEMLAAASSHKGNRSGRVFKTGAQGWDEAVAYIKAIMLDD
jgi:hypothetical protein